jgi:F-type H+-transporting ATPase subunit epsilon
MSTFHLEVVALDRVFYEGDCESLTIPAVDGEKGILASHEPMVMAIAAGEMRISAAGKQQIAAVGTGFVEVTGEKVIVITDFAQKPEEIDIEEEERVRVHEEERLREKRSQIEFAHSQAELARAMAKLKVARKGSRR